MSKKVIYAEDLLWSMRDDPSINGAHFARIREHIEAAPAVDAVEVVHGKWTRVTAGYYECSNCMSHIAVFSGHKNYCPNCGAKMDGGNEDA